MSSPRRLRVPDPLRQFLRSLHPHIKRKVRAALDVIVYEPDCGKPLKGDLEGLWSFRVGRFRIIYRFEAAGDIELVAVGPRKAIYQEIRRLRHRR